MIDPKHPRAKSLKTREEIIHGVDIGITSINGLIAQGRGEAFDYLLGENTNNFAKEAIRAAAAMLFLAKDPVLSVNGNTAALVVKEYIELSNLLHCPIEINLFHKTKERELRIKSYLESLRAKNVLVSNSKTKISSIASKRKFVNPKGIGKADVVFVPLEDGDRTEELIKLGKKVITIDLNPMSRTAQKATITIVDNIIRAFPLLIKETKRLQSFKKDELKKFVREFSNKKILNAAEEKIRKSF